MKEALIIDDHPIVLARIKELLQRSFPSIEIRGSSGAQKVIEEVCGFPWTFVVLDMNLPGQNGIEVLKQAQVRCPHTPIVVFSMFSEQQYAGRALRAGAIAYLSKDRSTVDLVDAVKLALRGGLVKRPRTALVPILSDREIQVLTCLAEGRRGIEIARHLRISEKTVSTYKGRLLRKLELDNLADLIRYATEEGLVG